MVGEEYLEVLHLIWMSESRSATLEDFNYGFHLFPAQLFQGE